MTILILVLELNNLIITTPNIFQKSLSLTQKAH